MKFFILACLAITLFLAYGCTYRSPAETGTASEEVEPDQAAAEADEKGSVAENAQAGASAKIDAKLNPARDLTGDWSGIAAYSDNVANPACSYEARFDMSLQQFGNDVQGTYILAITKATQLISTVPCLPPGSFPPATVTGTVSSSLIELSDGFTEYSGSYTSSLMTLSMESCPDQRCPDGSFGVGIKGTAKLLRQE